MIRGISRRSFITVAAFWRVAANGIRRGFGAHMPTSIRELTAASERSRGAADAIYTYDECARLVSVTEPNRSITTTFTYGN